MNCCQVYLPYTPSTPRRQRCVLVRSTHLKSFTVTHVPCSPKFQLTSPKYLPYIFKGICFYANGWNVCYMSRIDLCKVFAKKFLKFSLEPKENHFLKVFLIMHMWLLHRLWKESSILCSLSDLVSEGFLLRKVPFLGQLISLDKWCFHFGLPYQCLYCI